MVPADMLLLAGTCIVEEAVLTGESTPQWKAPVGAPADPSAAGNGAAAEAEGDEVAESVGVDPKAHLNIKRDRALVLFGGTKVLQHTPDASARLKTPDGGCLAVVLRTGFETAQGGLAAPLAVEVDFACHAGLHCEEANPLCVCALSMADKTCFCFSAAPASQFRIMTLPAKSFAAMCMHTAAQI